MPSAIAQPRRDVRLTTIFGAAPLGARGYVGGELTRREAALAAFAGVALAVAMSWPLVLHLGSDVGKDLGDPLLQAWQVAWIGHALLHAPLDLWQANTFWPYDDTLAFSDVLVGYAPAGLMAQASPHAALVTYNILFLAAYCLAFLGAYLLAREIGIGWIGAAAAGAAFAYAPWKLSQNGHLHVISSGGIPLALFLLLRGYRRVSPPTVLCGWLVVAWQMTLGFTLGLQLAYLLAVLAAIALVALISRNLPRPDRLTVAATALGLSVFVAATVFMALPHLRVVDAHPEARKTVKQVVDFSPPRTSFLAAPVESWLWSDPTRRVRETFGAYDEMVLFPGVAISVLALLGVLGSVLSRRLRIGLVVGVARARCSHSVCARGAGSTCSRRTSSSSTSRPDGTASARQEGSTLSRRSGSPFSPVQASAS